MDIILDGDKRYTYADYQTWLDDKRRELINGFVSLMTPAPARLHQKVSGSIFNKLYNFLSNKNCEVYSAPFDVRLPKNGNKTDDKIYDVVQPDITVVCNPEKLDDKGCIGAPDLIVEILSPSTSKRDLTVKYELYEKTGVKEYWIARPGEKTIQKFVLNKDMKYEFKGTFTEDTTISPDIFPDLQIDISSVFK